MRKTTIYLPDELKARVERTARTQRRSEADVIRAAIDAYAEPSGTGSGFALFEGVAPITDWDEAMRGFGDD